MPIAFIIVSVGVSILVLYGLFSTYFSRALNAKHASLPRSMIAILGGLLLCVLFFGVAYQMAPAWFEQLHDALLEPAKILHVDAKIWLLLYGVLAISFLVTAFLFSSSVKISWWRSVATLASAAAMIVNVGLIISLGVSTLAIGVPDQSTLAGNNTEKTQAELDALFESFQQQKTQQPEVVEFEFADTKKLPTGFDGAGLDPIELTKRGMVADITLGSETQACLDALDPQPQAEMKSSGLIKWVELRSICDDGLRAEAQQVAVKFSGSHHVSSAAISQMACFQKEAGSARLDRVPTVADLEQMHICDYIDVVSEIY